MEYPMVHPYQPMSMSMFQRNIQRVPPGCQVYLPPPLVAASPIRLCADHLCNDKWDVAHGYFQPLDNDGGFEGYGSEAEGFDDDEKVTEQELVDSHERYPDLFWLEVEEEGLGYTPAFSVNEKRAAAARREETAKNRFLALREEVENSTSPNGKKQIMHCNPSDGEHLTQPCFRDFKRFVEGHNGWKVRRREATETQRRDHKVKRKSKTYWVELTYKNCGKAGKTPPSSNQKPSRQPQKKKAPPKRPTDGEGEANELSEHWSYGYGRTPYGFHDPGALEDQRKDYEKKYAANAGRVGQRH